MRLLKKASINDILEKNITSNYKEIELYTSLADIGSLNEDGELEEKTKKIIIKVVNKLKEDKAIISAIHGPESLFKTLTDNQKNKSTNYLSVCETIKDENSNEILKIMIKISEEICCKQWDIKYKKENHTDIDSQNSSKYNMKKYEKILLILHSGCEIGCQNNEHNKEECKVIEDEKIEKFKEVIKSNYVTIAIENITPYIDYKNDSFDKGKNCGWEIVDKIEQNNNIVWNCFELAKQFDVKICIDICHIIATHYIINEEVNYSLAIDEYMKYIKDNSLESYIALFHISNYDITGKHGTQFGNSNNDNNLVEEIRTFCYEISEIPLVTLEVKDGEDYKKSCDNFDKLMLKLSERHTSGLFNELINEDKDLKQYFDDLYYVYTSKVKNIYEIRKRAIRIKKYIFSNTYIKKEKRQINIPFNFSKDSEVLDTNVFIMQAYIYYTRFCNLAIELLKYYKEDSIIENNNKANDFVLALKYFMFNDNVKQIEYTGIGFKFNVNWMPQRSKFYRFYDGIDESKFIVKNDKDIIEGIIESICNQVGQTGENRLFSVGKHFDICLFKYYQPPLKEDSWTVKVYEKHPINFIDYKGKRYSIPAFMQLLNEEDMCSKDITNFSFDISKFNKSLGDAMSKTKDASSLFSMFRYYINTISPIEKTGCITDGEIVFLKLEDETDKFIFNKYSSLVLFKSYLKMISNKENIKKISNEEIEEIEIRIDEWIENRAKDKKLWLKDYNSYIELSEVIKNKSELGQIKKLLNSIEIDKYNSKEVIRKLESYESKAKAIKALFWEIEENDLQRGEKIYG